MEFFKDVQSAFVYNPSSRPIDTYREESLYGILTGV
jgi:hypothetical protein